MTVKLTAAEASMVLNLLTDNEIDGTYYGNKTQWDNRRRGLIDKLMAAVHAG
jgi:hypothetical protein